MVVADVTTHKKTRIVSVIAATAIALACGTNVSIYSSEPRPDGNLQQYAYSAWAPQFADKLQLSATQSNVIVRFFSIAWRRPLIALGNGCKPRDVRFGHTYGHHHGQKKPTSGGIDWHDMFVCWILSRSHRYAIYGNMRLETNLWKPMIGALDQ
jgi:hypothetical protein